MHARSNLIHNQFNKEEWKLNFLPRKNKSSWRCDASIRKHEHYLLLHHNHFIERRRGETRQKGQAMNNFLILPEWWTQSLSRKKFNIACNHMTLNWFSQTKIFSCLQNGDVVDVFWMKGGMCLKFPKICVCLPLTNNWKNEVKWKIHS